MTYTWYSSASIAVNTVHSDKICSIWWWSMGGWTAVESGWPCYKTIHDTQPLFGSLHGFEPMGDKTMEHGACFFSISNGDATRKPGDVLFFCVGRAQVTSLQHGGCTSCLLVRHSFLVASLMRGYGSERVWIEAHNLSFSSVGFRKYWHAPWI